MLEFRINDYITLRLEHNHTTIYVNNEIFDQCRKILFINPHNNEKQKMIDSIDEAAEFLDKTLERKEQTKYDIELMKRVFELTRNERVISEEQINF